MQWSAPTPFVQQRRRLRRVIEHIGDAVRNELGDEALCLRRLAQAANWSPEHLDRAYRRACGEPPLATVRRLRLKHAAAALQGGGALRDVAERAGYASTQAFGRAFRRQFGMPPLQWLAAARPHANEPQFGLVRLGDDVACHALHFRGAASGISTLFDETVLRLQRCGSPRAQWQVFGATGAHDGLGTWSSSGGQREVSAIVLAPPLARAPSGMATWLLPRGTYARLPAADLHLHPWEDALRDAGWVRTDGPVLRHYDTDPAYVAAQERREWWYLPVAPRSARA